MMQEQSAFETSHGNSLCRARHAVNNWFTCAVLREYTFGVDPEKLLASWVGAAHAPTPMLNKRTPAKRPMTRPRRPATSH